MIAALALALALAAPQGTGDWGPVSGVLVDAVGEPIPGVQVRAQRLDGDRRSVATLVDEHGRFAWRWLDLRGTYALALEGCGLDDRPGVLAPSPLRFDGTFLTLVADVVQLSGEVDGAGLRCVRTSGDPASPAAWRWGDVPDLGGERWLLGRGDTCVLLAWQRERGLVERSVEFAGDLLPRTRHVLALPPALPLAERVVRLVGPVPRDGLRMDVLAPLSRAKLLERLQPVVTRGEARWDLRLPPGSYLLRVEQGWSIPGMCAMGGNHWPVPRTCAREFEVEFGADTHVAFEAVWPASEVATVKVAAPGVAHATAWRVDAEDRPVELLDIGLDIGPRRGWVQGQQTWRIPVDTPCRLWNPLAVGRHRILFAAEGCVPRIVDVHAVLGQTPWIEVALDPLP